MTRARVVVLGVAAAIVIGASIWLSAQRSLPRDTRAGDLILPSLATDLEAIEGVSLARGNGSVVTLRKEAGGWVVVERAFPADAGRLRALLTALAQLHVVEEKTHDPKLYARLGVEEVSLAGSQGTLIEVAAPEGNAAALIVGKSASAKHSYVRVPGQAASFLVAPQITADPDPRRWIATRIVDIPDGDVREVAVTPVAGPAYVAARPTPEEPLLLKGRSVAMPVGSLLSALDCEDVEPAMAVPSPGAKPATIVRTFSGLEIAVEGREDGERRFVRFEPRALDTQAETAANELATRVTNREFEIARYRYDSLFRPLPDPT
jgi:hypothetical protein